MSQSPLLSPFDHLNGLVGVPFSWNLLFSRRTDIPDIDAQGTSVAIVGGGIAGLVAAFELQARNFKVTVIEASGRLGGRIYTHHFTGDFYGELGAMRIPLVHSAVVDYLKLLDLPTREFSNWSSDSRFLFNNVRSEFFCSSTRNSEKVAHHAVLGSAFPGLGRLSCEETAANASQLLLDILIMPLLESLSDEEKWQLFLPTSRTPIIQLLRSTLLADYVKKELDFTPADWQYFSRATGIAPLEGCTVAQFLSDMVPVLSSAMLEIVGGMDRLPLGLAARFNATSTVLLQTTVESVTIDENCVTITAKSASNAIVKHNFDYVILTPPPRSLDKLTVRPASAFAKRRATLEQIKTRPLAKSLVLCSSPFWATHGTGRGGFSATDLPIQQCWYPSSNFGSASSAVLTGSYRWGVQAERFSELTTEERTQELLSGLALLHGVPVMEVEQSTVEIKHHFWAEGYTALGPNDGEIGAVERLAIPETGAGPDSRVLLAGEHVGCMHGWIASSVLSALRTVRELVSLQQSGIPSSIQIRSQKRS